MNVNKAILVGRLTRDPELRTTQTGQSVTTFGLATGRTWTDKNGQKQEKTEFHNIVLWGRLAEIASQYLTKGQETYIEGRLQNRTYTAKDGTEKRITEIVGEIMQMGSRPRGAEHQPKNSAPAATQSAAPTEEIPTINLDDEQGEVKIEDVPF